MKFGNPKKLTKVTDLPNPNTGLPPKKEPPFEITIIWPKIMQMKYHLASLQLTNVAIYMPIFVPLCPLFQK